MAYDSLDPMVAAAGDVIFVGGHMATMSYIKMNGRLSYFKDGQSTHTHTPFSSGLWGFPVWGLGSSVEGLGAGCSGLGFTAVMYMRVQPCQIWRPQTL